MQVGDAAVANKNWHNETFDHQITHSEGTFVRCKMEEMARLSKEERARRARERAKLAIVGLVAASEGRLVGKLRLYKAFYKAHLIYFESTGLDLTGYSMVHMPNGPGIDNAQELIDELMESGALLEAVGNGDRAFERVYTLGPNVPTEADAEKSEAIRQAADWANALTERELKDGSHNRSWRESFNGEEQNIFVDTLSDERVGEIRREGLDRLGQIELLVEA